MTKKKPILCRWGFHKWRDYKHQGLKKSKCLRCGKRASFELESFFSGGFIWTKERRTWTDG